MTPSSDSLRVTVLGCGAIGSAVASALASGDVENAHLVGVVVRRPNTPAAQDFPILDLADAIRQSDLVVECAGAEAVHEEGRRPATAGFPQ